MLHLNICGLQDHSGWQAAQIALPRYDVAAMQQRTLVHPNWLHFGAGNIFYAFLAAAQQTLLNTGAADSGIVAVASHNFRAAEDTFKPHDGLSLLVRMHADGTSDKEVIGSVAGCLKADWQDGDWHRLQEMFQDPALQMVSFTITEKGYALCDMNGQLLPVVQTDLSAGPDRPRHTLSIVVSLLHSRFLAGGTPAALVSMDNCAQNGKKLRDSCLAIASAWAEHGFVSDAFLRWISDEKTVSFPWTMIDKITPYPSEKVARELTDCGVADMTISTSATGSISAPFVNAEVTEYLVVEDAFPNGRPPLEQAGVYFTDRLTVERSEKMKVGTCLNPLHTALAIFGCLLGYRTIAAEMQDPELTALVRGIAAESLPVVEDPGIIRPEAFIRQVLTERFPNPAIPDTPQRIATDSSQKIPVRYGGTLQRYKTQGLSMAELRYIPLVFAGWCRYLLSVDDAGRPMELSPDPLLPQLRPLLADITWNDPSSLGDRLKAILAKDSIFGVNLYEVGLGQPVEDAFRSMLEGPGAVRNTLKRLMREKN